MSNKTMRLIETLKFDPTNARKHDERNIKAIMDSLRMHGQRKPVVLYSDIIIAGNGTVEAAKRLGWTEVWVNNDKFESLEAARAYAIQDNRSAELASWDDPVLGETLTELKDIGFDLDEIGFNDAEVNALMNKENNENQKNEVLKRDIFEVVVECVDENEQETIFNSLISQGLKCRVLSM